MAYVLYRAYDTDDRLLYVGITNNLPRRLREHRCNESWWGSLVSQVESAAAPSQKVAFVWEAKLIHLLKPPYNRMIGHGWNVRDERIIQLRAAGKTRGEIAAELGMREQPLSKTIRKLLATGDIPRKPPGQRRRA